MAVSFKIPKSPSRSVLEIDSFLGVDLTNSGTDVSEYRSPNAPNMIRDVPGKVRKRMGYKTVKSFEEGIIYGVHSVKSISEAKVMGRNLCSGRTLRYNKLDAGESVYIYSNSCCLPVGTMAHIQFLYKTSGELEITPYYETPEITSLKSLNTVTQFNANYYIKEATNAFKITNVTNDVISVELTDIMISFTDEELPFNPSYSSYSEINETRIYDLGEDSKIPDQEAIISDTTPVVELNINPNNLYGLVAISGTLKLTVDSGVQNPTKITVKYKGIRDGVEIELPACNVFDTFNPSYSLFTVIDPAINHIAYDISTSKLTKIEVTAEFPTPTYSGKVTLEDIIIRPLSLKANFDANDIVRLLHVSNKMYLEVNGHTQNEPLTIRMNTHRSISWQNERKLYIIDGLNYWVYNQDDYSLKNVAEEIPTSLNNEENIAYIPTVTIAKSPSGGGVSYESLNLLTPAFIELFAGEDEAKIFHLSFNNLDNTTVKAWVMDDNGVFREKYQDIDFSVNTSEGTVTFNDAPGVSPLAGEDNVKILAYRTIDGYADMIRNCTVGALFGVNGAADRIFLSGNPNYKNRDWHSGQYQFNYFEDTSYSRLGSDSSAIVGYSIVNNYLATHKDENDPTQAVIIREGDLIVTGESSTDGKTTTYNNEPSFKIINTLQGAGAIASYSFATLQTEPVFLTRSGIQAITPQDVTGEKYSQNRSFYLDGQLLEEADLDNACALVYNDMYLLFVNTKVYVLDGLQAMRTDKSEPYASRQYVGFLLKDIPASVAWLENNELWFGTTDGRICKVYSDKEALESYNDDGKPIEAWWETCDIDGARFYKKKTFRYVAVRLKANIKTRVSIYSMTRGLWTHIKDSKILSNRVFQFSGIKFSELTFNNDKSDPVVSSKLRVKKIDKARFKLENKNLNEPFGLQDLAFEFVESGNFKG